MTVFTPKPGPIDYSGLTKELAMAEYGLAISTFLAGFGPAPQHPVSGKIYKKPSDPSGETPQDPPADVVPKNPPPGTPDIDLNTTRIAASPTDEDKSWNPTEPHADKWKDDSHDLTKKVNMEAMADKIVDLFGTSNLVNSDFIEVFCREMPSKCIKDSNTGKWSLKSDSPGKSDASTLTISKKRAQNIKGLRPAQKRTLEAMTPDDRLRHSGVGLTSKIEPKPHRVDGERETKIEGQTNAHIVLGADRPRSRGSGYGGRGDSQCAAIDIVAGSGGPLCTEEMFVDPNFNADATRIYISQKTEIDKNFKLVDPKTGRDHSPDPGPASGIGIKADGVRVIARHGIKLVTGTDLLDSQNGNTKGSISGIDIIGQQVHLKRGKPGSDLQPLVKGGNLIKCLESVITAMSKLNGIMDAFVTYQINFNHEVGNHRHISPFGGEPTSMGGTGVDERLCTEATGTIIDQFEKTHESLKNHQKILIGIRRNYLKKGSPKLYINSIYNNCN